MPSVADREMRRLLIAVEGQTEERFVKDVLAHHLRSRDIEPIPTLLRTKIVREGGHFKGGLTRFRQAEERIKKLLQDSNAVRITTMFDYSGAWRNDFLTNYRRARTLQGKRPSDKVKELEHEMEDYFDSPRFRAFVLLHEYEGLLFSNPIEIAAALNQPSVETGLVEIRRSFPTPEDINDRPDFTPSRRLLALIPGYQKPAHGALIASRIGLEAIRRECPHFGEWLSAIEAIGA